MTRATRSLWLGVSAASLFAIAAFAVCFSAAKPAGAAAAAIRIDAVLIFIIWLAGKLKFIRPTPADEEHCEPLIPWPYLLLFAAMTAAAAACFVDFRLASSGAGLLLAMVGGTVAMLIAFIGEIDTMLGSSGTGTVMFAFGCEAIAVVGGCLTIVHLFS